jgi:hypothetical protein
MLRKGIAISLVALGPVLVSSAHAQAAPVEAQPANATAGETGTAIPNLRSSAPVAGLTPANNALARYREREVRTRASFWRQQELFRGAIPLELGYFGGGYADIFAGSAAALDSMSTFQTLRIIGTTTYVVGLGLLVADFVLLAQRSSSVVSLDAQSGRRSTKPLAWGLLIPGGVLGISGAFMIQGANAYVSDAIDHYNDDLVKQIQLGALGPKTPIRGLSFSGKF